MKYKVMCESPNIPKAILHKLSKNVSKSKITFNSPDVPADVLKSTKKRK